MRTPDQKSEERLETLRKDARQFDGAGAATQARSGGVASTARGPDAPLRGYAGRPILKPPVWTWEVPVYFFVGGAGGAAAVIGFAALLSDTWVSLARPALWIAAVCGAISPILLTSDLGRPARALNMFRVF